MDNLGSGTYETFERDPVKYERYEEVSNKAAVPGNLYDDYTKAIFQALSDRGNSSRT